MNVTITTTMKSLVGLFMLSLPLDLLILLYMGWVESEIVERYGLAYCVSPSGSLRGKR